MAVGGGGEKDNVVTVAADGGVAADIVGLRLGFGELVIETRTVLGAQPDPTPKHVSRMKMSSIPHAGNVSPGT